MAKIYATAFPVYRSKKIEDLAQVVKKWIAGSPHRSVTEKDLEDLNLDGFAYKGENFSVQSARHTNGQEMYGIRLREISKNAVRTTDIVGCKDDDSFDVAVTHNYEAVVIGARMQGMSKPRIVNDIVVAMGGMLDGKMLRMQNKAYFLTPNDLEFVAEIVNNQSDNQLPVVYLSKSREGRVAANPNQLAFKLGGMGHVLVEPSVDFSFSLRRETDGNNTFGGAAGIYWPNGLRHVILPTMTKNVGYDVYDRIQEHALLQLMPNELTFDGILNRQSIDRLEEIKRINTEIKRETTEEERQKTIDEALEIAVDQIEGKDKEIGELRSKIGALEQKIVQQSRQRTTAEGEMLQSPQIAEMYPGELRDIVIEAVNNYRNAVVPDSRRQDMLDSVLKANQMTGEKDEILRKLGAIFKSASRKLTADMERELRKLGLVVERGGKHSFVYVPGHEGRKCTISNTASDHRSMKNTRTEIKNKLL